MKILLFTDMHISSSGSMNCNRLPFIYKTIDWLGEVAKTYKVDEVINCGDLTDKTTLNQDEISAISKLMKTLDDLEIPHTHILGNHEIFDSDGLRSSIKGFIDLTLEGQLVDTTFLKIISGEAIIRLAAYSTDTDFIKRMITTRDTPNILLTHKSLTENPMFCEDMEPYEHFDLIFNGHVHNPSKFGNVVNIGSCLGSNLADDYKNGRPGIIILDTDNINNFKRIENPHSMLYFRANNIEEIPEVDRARSYVKFMSKVETEGLAGSVVDLSFTLETNEFNASEDMMANIKEYFKGDNEVIELLKEVEECK